MVWERDYQSPSGGAFGKTIALSTNGDVDVAGMNYDVGSDTNIIMLIYKPDGTLTTSKEYDAGGTEIASNLESDYWGNIYIHGTSSSNENGYVTVKYSFFDRQLFEVNDTVDSIDYIDNELLIQFYPEYIDSNTVDDKGKTYGILSEFVLSAAIDTMNALFEGQYDFGRMHTLKVFTGLSTKDSNSITRSGDTIKMPPFFATLLILTPSQLDELTASVHLDTAGTGILEFAQVNQIAYPADLPNDHHFTQGDQDGLESTNSPENDINMDRAWDIQKGKDNVKVGIIDSGIDWDHIDFNETGTYSTNSNHSKVKNGYDFYNFFSPFSTVDNDSYGHGTKVSGIVGAIRNNNEGVAGIAGGDDSTANFGASLIDLKVGDSSFPIDRVIDAIVEGAKDQPSNSTNPGYAVHILNMSFGHKKTDKAEETAIRFAYNNECVIAASAGNDNKEKPRYPSSYADRMVIRVGASSDDGARYNHQNFGSNYGHGLDIIAPGIPPLVYTTNNNDTGYTNFAQTSAAAPHVTGVATLLHSQVKSNYNPNQLAPEDVEQLIERYRTDVGAQGYDAQNGHGRLNAGDVLEHMEWPFYWVEHNSSSTTNYDSTLLFQDTKVKLERGHDGIERGRYKCDIVLITCTLSHSLGGADMLGAWALNGSTYSTPYNYSTSALKPEANIQLTSIDDNTAVLQGYVYHFKDKWPFGGNIDQWIPFEPGQTGSFGYSMHLYDEEASGTNESQNVLDRSVRVYPNPTSNSQRIDINESGSVVIELIDLQGRIIQNVYQGSSNGNLSIDNDIRSLNSGIYIYNITIDEISHSIRIIKQL